MYQRFFDVTGDYEWLRWILSFFIALFIGFIAWISKAAITNLNEGKFYIVEKVTDYNEVLGFIIYFMSNVILAAIGSIIAVYYEPTAAGSGIPEVKAYLNGTKVCSMVWSGAGGTCAHLELQQSRPLLMFLIKLYLLGSTFPANEDSCWEGWVHDYG